MVEQREVLLLPQVETQQAQAANPLVVPAPVECAALQVKETFPLVVPVPVALATLAPTQVPPTQEGPKDQMGPQQRLPQPPLVVEIVEALKVEPPLRRRLLLPVDLLVQPQGLLQVQEDSLLLDGIPIKVPQLQVGLPQDLPTPLCLSWSRLVSMDSGT